MLLLISYLNFKKGRFDAIGRLGLGQLFVLANFDLAELVISAYSVLAEFVLANFVLAKLVIRAYSDLANNPLPVSKVNY